MRAFQKFIRRGIKPFIKGESGLVTVEWVALAAAVVVGGIAVVWFVMDNMERQAQTVGSNINPLATTDPNPAP